MAKKSNARKSAGPAIVDPDEQLDLSNVAEGDELPISDEWVAQFVDSKVGFFDALSAIPEGGWEKLSIYLYRLDPAVSNKPGEKKYIGVYGGPVTEESIKAEHGGGKFHAFVKHGVQTLRNHRFWIEGEPIYKEGQTLRGTPAAGTPLPPGSVPQQDIGSIVRQVIEATGGNSKAADAGIEVMQKAMLNGLELNKTIMTSQMNSTTGTTLGDKMIDLLLPRLMAPPVAPTTDPIILKLVEAAIANMKADRREQNPPPTPVAPTDQLSLLKEVTGVESLKELFDLGRGGREQPWWVSMLSNAVEKLPTILNEFAQMQERAFQRAVIAHQLAAGNALPPPNPNMIRTDVARVGPQNAPQTPPPVPSQGNMSEQMVQALVEGICRAYDDGYGGDDAAVHIKLLYPHLVEGLIPLLSNPVQLNAFVANLPPLAERSREEDWAEFQQQFMEEVMRKPDDSLRPPAESVSRETLATAQPAAGRVVSPKPPGKKRANGSAA